MTSTAAGRPEKIAPVQGYSAGIPWSMHLRAYDAYCKKYGRQDALIDLEGRGCRGGFGVNELDMFIPGWREELSELHQLRRSHDDLAKALNTAKAAMGRWISDGIGDDIVIAFEEVTTALAAAKTGGAA
jgi:hypothetical protein